MNFDYRSEEYRRKLKKQNLKIKSLFQRDEIVKKIARGKILELGCGEFPLFKNSTKIDIAKIDGCIKADLNKPLPLKGKFDTIISLDVIEHLWKIDCFLKECRRLLRYNGMLILSTPNVMNFWNRFGMLLNDELTISNYFNGMFEMGHTRYFTPYSLRKELEEHNFVVKKMIPLGRIKVLSLCGGFICIAKTKK